MTVCTLRDAHEETPSTQDGTTDEHWQHTTSPCMRVFIYLFIYHLFIYQIWLIELSLYLYRVCYKLRDTNLGQTSNSGKEKLPFIRKDP